MVLTLDKWELAALASLVARSFTEPGALSVYRKKDSVEVYSFTSGDEVYKMYYQKQMEYPLAMSVTIRSKISPNIFRCYFQTGEALDLGWPTPFLSEIT